MTMTSARDTRRLIALAAAAGIVAATFLTAGCSKSSPAPSTTSATPVSLPGLGAELPAGQIPWNQVGPGWMLATWSPDRTSGPPPVTLYLLDPAGGRYPITTLPVASDGLTTLVDWSGDHRRALFANSTLKSETMTEIDLATGARHDLALPGARIVGYGHVTYSPPDSQAIFRSSRDLDGTASGSLERVDFSSTKRLAFPTDLGTVGAFNGDYLASPDGTMVVLGAAKGMAVAGDDAAVTRQLPMPVPLTGCSPVRWWTSTSILAFCGDTSHATGVQCGTTSQSPGSQLWQVPLNGGAPTALTALNTGRQNDQDLADANAWQLPAGTFLQSYGPCGFTFASRLTPDLHTTPIKASGVPNGARVVGATADKLVLQADSLVSYDPATDTATVVLGPPVNGGRVHDAILW